MIDPLGPLVLEVRAYPGVAALGAKVAGGGLDPTWVAPNAPDPRPFVVLLREAPDRAPFGPGSSRVGLQGLFVLARCYGAPDGNGDERVARRTSADLMGAVSDALHDRGPRRASGGRLLYQTNQVSGSGGPGTDPDTRWPYEVARFRVVAVAQPVA